jgi:hypothetical protein
MSAIIAMIPPPLLVRLCSELTVSKSERRTCVAQEEGDDPVVRKVLVDDLTHGGLSYESATLRGRRVS